MQLEGKLMAHDTEAIDGRTFSTILDTDSESTMHADACPVEVPPDSCGIVILGATGDLTMRKLAPALYRLFVNNGMPESFFVLGAARSDLTIDQFREEVRQALASSDLTQWKGFGDRLHYQSLRFDSAESYSALAATIGSLHDQYGTRGNTILYLAIPPSLYELTAGMLGAAGLAENSQEGTGWVRIVVEKPFGHSLQSAIHLNRTLTEYFSEQQIFRIDHYLAKETVQNVLMFRFANAIFEPLWNRMFIDRVHITAAESLGIEKRAPYYEDAGVLRDMFQNHMMQLLALIAMEPPSRFDADFVRDETCKVFRSLRHFSPGDTSERVVLGQYGPGSIDGKQVAGYRQEPGVNPESLTPTFATMKVFVDNWRWQGVPFILTSGKRMAKKITHMVIRFKQVPHSLFRNFLEEEIRPNVLTLGVYPDETIRLSFETKNLGARVCLRSVAMDFNYHSGYEGPVLDAYEKAILDCMIGDQTLFWREDAVELAWAFLEPVLEQCETCADRGAKLLPYAAGTWGPETGKSWKD